jgi:hypothetical protein
VSTQDLKLAAAKMEAYIQEQAAALQATEKPCDGQSNGQSSSLAYLGASRKLLN